MRDNLEGGELDAADDIRRRCKKILLRRFEDKRSCDRGSELGPVFQRRDVRRTVSLRKPPSLFVWILHNFRNFFATKSVHIEEPPSPLSAKSPQLKIPFPPNCRRRLWIVYA